MPRRVSKMLEHLKEDAVEVWSLSWIVILAVVVPIVLVAGASLFWWPIVYTFSTGHTPNMLF